MYARKYADREFTFDFATGLIKDNLLFVDRETQSIWSQLDGKAVSGPMKESPLQVVPSMQTTWKHWLEMHPDSRVMHLSDEEGNSYYYRSRKPGAPKPKTRSKKHDTSALGLALKVGDEAAFFPFSELEQATLPLKFEVGGQELLIHYRKDAMTAWATDSAGDLVTTVLAYKFGWLDFNPASKIFRAKENEKRGK